MTKQCGNCKWFLSTLKECNYPEDKLPVCASKWRVWEKHGTDCPVYAESQDAAEEDEDRPDENGYTRADEDWFFDDKDD